MNAIQIKKEIYKQKTIAKLLHIRKGIATYTTYINSLMNEETRIIMSIPIDDMGEATFYTEMDAKLLIRWVDVQEILENLNISDVSESKNHLMMT